MHISIIFIGYQLIQLIILPFIGVYFLVRLIKKKEFGTPLERLGWVTKAPATHPVIWLHAVSVGEVLALQHLIAEIKKQNSTVLCYVTVGTSSGKKIAQAHVPADYISFLPFDFLPCMLLAYKRINPQMLILIEGDLWPNLLMIGNLKKVPMFLLNARVNTRSEKNMFRASKFFGTILNYFSLIFSQAITDNEKFRKLGVQPHKLKLLGNLKAFNVLAKKNEFKKKNNIERNKLPFQILLVGSIHPGELIHYIELFKALKPKYPNLRMILAPRHFNWQDQLSHALDSSKISHTLWDEKNRPLLGMQSLFQNLSHVFNDHDILAVCMLGTLFNLYQYANIFFLGGTFVTIGGHNLLEPAVWGIPMIVGPYYSNCKEHAEKLSELKALIKVATIQHLIDQTNGLLKDHHQRDTMSKQATYWLANQAKAVEKNLEPLMQNIKQTIISFEQQLK